MTEARLDHLAVAVTERAHGLRPFLGTFGGRWLFDTDAGDYRMCHIDYDGGMKIELLEPSRPDSFLPRFLTRSGPGPHHITFKVDDLGEFRRRAAALGVDLIGGRDSPMWSEVFVHPKATRVGTLLQAARADEQIGSTRTPLPPDAPSLTAPEATLAWYGIVSRDAAAADDTFAKLFGGTHAGRGHNGEGHWILRSWAGKHILLLQPDPGAPLDHFLGGRPSAVHHVAFIAPPESGHPLGFLAPDHATGIDYLVVDHDWSWLRTAQPAARS